MRVGPPRAGGRRPLILGTSEDPGFQPLSVNLNNLCVQRLNSCFYHLGKYTLIFCSNIYCETIILCSESPRKRMPNTVWWIQWSDLIMLACRTGFLPAWEQGHQGLHLYTFCAESPSLYGIFWSHHSKVPRVRNPCSKGAGQTNLGSTGSSSPRRWKTSRSPGIYSGSTFSFFGGGWFTDGKIKPQRSWSKERYFTELD